MRWMLAKSCFDSARYEEAKTHYEAVLELQDLPEAWCNLGHTCRQLGLYREALTALQRGHELGSRQPDWSYPSADWVREVREIAEKEPQLLALVGGDNRGSAADLWLAAGMAQSRRGNRRAAELASIAFARDPALADDYAAQNRYAAVCYAALAGCGQGKDADELDDAGRARWRGQALEWLRADLAHWAAALRQGEKEVALKTLRWWQEDADLAGVRGDEALAKLPAAEAEAWTRFWVEVARVLQTAQ